MIIFAIMMARFSHGMYYTLIDKYFTNFSNKDIDTKIFAVKNLVVNMTSAIMGFMASFLLGKGNNILYDYSRNSIYNYVYTNGNLYENKSGAKTRRIFKRRKKI